MSTAYFDSQASIWDTPERVRRAQVWIEAVRSKIPLSKQTIVADFGAGTGLVAFALSSHVGKVIALDNSPGMLEQLQKKCLASDLPQIQGQFFDIEKDLIGTDICDVFMACMVLHHLKSVPDFAHTAWRATRPGGWIVIIDLDAEGGEFHADHDGVHHHGFEHAELTDIFTTTGFDSIEFSEVYRIHKTARSGTQRDFTLFMLIAQKPFAEE